MKSKKIIVLIILGCGIVLLACGIGISLMSKEEDTSSPPEEVEEVKTYKTAEEARAALNTIEEYANWNIEFLEEKDNVFIFSTDQTDENNAIIQIWVDQNNGNINSVYLYPEMYEDSD